MIYGAADLRQEVRRDVDVAEEFAEAHCRTRFIVMAYMAAYCTYYNNNGWSTWLRIMHIVKIVMAYMAAYYTYHNNMLGLCTYAGCVCR